MFLVAPVGTRRNNNVIITSRRRFDVTVTLLLRRVPAGLLASAQVWALSFCTKKATLANYRK